MDITNVDDEDSKIGFLDRSKLNEKLLKRGIPVECSELIQHGLYNYMREIISDIYSVLIDLQVCDDAYKKKVLNTHGNLIRENTEASSKYSKVILSDPLGEYKHFEKVELEEQKIFIGKLNAREQKVEEEEKSQAGKGDPAKKKKAIFDDVICSHYSFWPLVLRDLQDHVQEPVGAQQGKWHFW